MKIIVEITFKANGRGSRSAMDECRNSILDFGAELESTVKDFLDQYQGDSDDPDVEWTVLSCEVLDLK